MPQTKSFLQRPVILISLTLVIALAIVVQQALSSLKQGAQAYLYGYPLVLMEQTRQVMVSPASAQAKVNHFTHAQVFPDHNFREVVRPNNDTLYSIAWIDLTEQPLVLTVPDTDGRYYVMPFMDAWTNVFDSVGQRTTGTQAGHYALTGPDWQGKLPKGVQQIAAPTDMVWLIGRIQTNGLDDIDNVIALQQQFLLTPLNRWVAGGAPNPAFVADNGGRGQDPAKLVEQMDTQTFFATLSELMTAQRPAASDAPMLALLKDFGIQPGQPFRLAEQGWLKRLALQQGMDIASRKMAEFADSNDQVLENGWKVIREEIGTYGNAYDVRAIVALFGLGALPTQEAIYPTAVTDVAGDDLNGEHRYRLHFAPGALPPADAFWSLTMYDEQGFLVDNPIRRYTLGNRDSLAFNDDGSLDIAIQHQPPKNGTSNWLPAPEGKFNITMRIYMPQQSFMDRSWALPPVRAID